jgi:heat shock protein HslJ
MGFDAAPGDLAGVRWMATAIGDGHGGLTAVIEGTHVDAVFGDEDTVYGSTGCNRFSGPWSLIGEMLAVGPMATTRMACPGRIMDQEAAFLRALERVTGYRRDGDRLELRDSDDEPVVVLEATPLS